jgi:mannose-1-phosphate guanylyltransferase/mannose-6-phosphate isomerase
VSTLGNVKPHFTKAQIFAYDEAMNHVHLGILSGGAGTRLWPVSREKAPKQFYDLANTGKSLLIDTVERLEKLGELSIITTDLLDKGTWGMLQKYGKKARIIPEPEAKNTAPAVALFTALCLKKDPKAVLGIFPADHVVKKTEDFHKAVEVALKTAASGKIVTLGIEPSYPSDAYGYIELESTFNTAEAKPLKVHRFIEKPSSFRAEELIHTNRVVWNAGIFIFSAATMGEKFEKHMPELWKLVQTVKEDLSNLRDVYAKAPKESIDYGVMEKLTDILCIPVDIGWSDLGSWEEISKHGLKADGLIEIDGRQNYYQPLPRTKKKASFVGVSDVVVVDTPDALLVVKKGHGQKVRDVVQTLKGQRSTLTQEHVFEERPWGRFHVLEDTDFFKSKVITVWSGQKLSYQSHKKRAEHWMIVKGEAEVTLDGETHRLKYGEHIHIPLGAKHRMANPGKEDLVFIEVQVGSYFGEDDIVRYEDVYGRS